MDNNKAVSKTREGLITSHLEDMFTRQLQQEYEMALIMGKVNYATFGKWVTTKHPPTHTVGDCQEALNELKGEIKTYYKQTND